MRYESPALHQDKSRATDNSLEPSLYNLYFCGGRNRERLPDHDIKAFGDFSLRGVSTTRYAMIEKPGAFVQRRCVAAQKPFLPS